MVREKLEKGFTLVLNGHQSSFSINHSHLISVSVRTFVLVVVFSLFSSQ